MASAHHFFGRWPPSKFKCCVLAISVLWNTEVCSIRSPIGNSSWGSAPPMLRARGGLAAVEFRGHLYALGGYDANYVPLSSVEVFNGTSWNLAPAMQTARYYFAAAVFKGVLYAIGGSGHMGTSATATVETFDGSQWHRATELLTPRAGLAASVFSGKLFVVGGSDGNGISALATVEAFDGRAWRQMLPLPSGRAFLATAVLGGLLFAVGGYDPLNFVLATVEAYDGRKWKPMTSMYSTRAGLAAFTCGNYLYALAGSNSSVLGQTSVEAFNGTVWLHVPALPLGLDDTSAVCSSTKQLRALGGYAVDPGTGRGLGFGQKVWARASHHVGTGKSGVTDIVYVLDSSNSNWSSSGTKLSIGTLDSASVV